MSKLPMKIDISEPKILLSVYKFTVRTEKPSKRAALVASTTRMIKSCLDTQIALARVLQSKSDTLKDWISRNRQIKTLKQKLAQAKYRLHAWISATMQSATQKI